MALQPEFIESNVSQIPQRCPEILSVAIQPLLLAGNAAAA